MSTLAIITTLYTAATENSASKRSPEMEGLRSKSYRYERSMQGDKPNSNPGGMQDLRCSSSSNGQIIMDIEQWKFNKGKSMNEVVSKSWSFSDPELQRRKRVAGYKAFSVEGKVKGSFRKSFRWIKDRCSLMVYGYRLLAVTCTGSKMEINTKKCWEDFLFTLCIHSNT